MRDNTGKNARRSTPLDFFRKSTEYASDAEASNRYSICENCPSFISISKQCAKCGCFMHLKTKIAHAECPVGKWQAVSVK